MTIKSLDYDLICDCLQPGCPYCDQDGFRTKEKEGFFIKALEEIHKKIAENLSNNDNIKKSNDHT